jgi:hypothetical protein
MSADADEAMRIGRRRRRTRGAVVGSAVAVAATAVVLLAVGLGAAPTTSGRPARESKPPGPTSTASVSPTSTPQVDSTDSLVPVPGRPSLDRAVPKPALAALRAAVHDLTVARSGYVRAVRARLVHYQVDRWRSPERFTLFVSLDLHFPGKNTMAWNQGSNVRFVQFTRSPGSDHYHLTWATSPF